MKTPLSRSERAPQRDALARLVDDLESRHLGQLTFPEIRRALQALSQIYVQKRERLGAGAVFDGAGKRAAFALYYGPLHFALTEAVLKELEPIPGRTDALIDLGCGTGVVGAAWALHCNASRVTGFDVSRWASDEARRCYRVLGLRGRVVTRAIRTGGEPLRADAIVAGYFVNELQPRVRDAVLESLLTAAQGGTRVLVIEPIARSFVRWWKLWTSEFLARGGRADEWRVGWDRPEIIARLDHAAKLDHRELRARTLYLGSEVIR